MILLSLEADGLLSLAGHLNVQDTDIGHVLGVDPREVMGWRLANRIPRRHVPPLVALLECTCVKAMVDCDRMGEPEDVKATVRDVAERLRAASAPMHKDSDQRKRYSRIVARMLRALEAKDQRAATGLPDFNRFGKITQ